MFMVKRSKKNVNHFHLNANYKNIRKDLEYNVAKKLMYVLERNVNQEISSVNGKDNHIHTNIKKHVKCSQLNLINI